MTSKSDTTNGEIGQKFRLGTIVATQGVLELQRLTGCNLLEFVDRHSKGDWGDLCSEDMRFNDEALRNNLRLLSAYKIPTGQKIWIITEWDRSYTTILLPEEY